MLRKNTKAYRDLVSSYCKARKSYEERIKKVGEFKALSDKSREAYERLKDSDPQVKVWHEFYVYYTALGMGLLGETGEEISAKMDEYGQKLVNDYGEDLEALYSKSNG